MALTPKRPSKATTPKEKLAKSLANESGEKARLNTEMEKSLYKRCQIQAVSEGRSLSEITRQLWLNYLDNGAE